MKIKICGLKTLDDIAVANKLLPDYVGFVFALKKREVTEEQAAKLRQALDKRISAVGVFLNDSNERIVRLLNNGTIDIAQLHGQETEEDIRYIRKQTGKPVIKAVVVRTPEDVLAFANSQADYLLLDGGTGSGTGFDLSFLKFVQRPFFLAGGLTPEKISAIPNLDYLYAFDISSGVEYPGEYRKNPQLMEQAVLAARNRKD